MLVRKGVVPFVAASGGLILGILLAMATSGHGPARASEVPVALEVIGLPRDGTLVDPHLVPAPLREEYARYLLGQVRRLIAGPAVPPAAFAGRARVASRG